MRNSVVDEAAIDPQWRRDLYELAREQSGDAEPHLARDWAAEEEKYDAVMGRLQDVSTLDEVLNTHPRSWRNLTSPDDATSNSTAEQKDDASR
jgi:hypothetical protein